MHRSSIVGIVGLGSIGGPLARLVRLATGRTVIGVDAEPDVLALLDRRMKSEPTAHGGDRYLLTTDPAALADADIVIEALPEDAAAKAEVLSLLHRVCPDRTVLVSTSSAVSLPRLAVASGRPDRVVGLRFFAPPTPGGPVEPVRTTMSSDEAHAALDELIEACGLTPVEVGARPAVDATALVHAYLNRAVMLVEQGYADHHAIDTALRLGCALPAGPLTALDEAGLDTVHAALTDAYRATGDPRFRPAALLTAMIADGAAGRKNGQGFYSYDESGVLSPTHTITAQSDTALSSSETLTAPNGEHLNSHSHPHPIRRVGIVGSGTMARGVAETIALADVPSVLVARSQAKAEAAAESIAASLTKGVRRGRIRPDQRTTAQERLQVGTGWAALAECDLVVETVVEDPDVKRTVFERLGRTCRPGTLLATTTSSLSVADVAQASGRPADVLGLHFFNPAPVMRLVELARTDTTGEDAVKRAEAFCRALGKTTVACRDRTGYIVNYLLFGYLADAVRLLEGPGADIEKLDAAFTLGFGYPMGPFALLDTIGLDVSLAILRRLHAAFPVPDFEPPVLLEQLVAQGRLGRKTGHGFWRPRSTSLGG